jgi:hypothetical protein
VACWGELHPCPSAGDNPPRVVQSGEVVRRRIRGARESHRRSRASALARSGWA